MLSGYPIILVNLRNSLSIVVGGGAVAERKVHSLLDAEARVRVIAPTLTDDLGKLVRDGQIEWLSRPFRVGDLAGSFLVIAATDDEESNGQVAREASERGLLVNVVDDPDECNFLAPAVVRRGGLTIAIGTSGQAPALAASLRARLETEFGDEWGPYLDWLARIRGRLAERYPDLDARRQAWGRVLDSQLRALVATHGDDEIEAYIARLLG